MQSEPIVRDGVVESNIGAIACQSNAGLVQGSFMMSCCVANALQAFYYAWEAIVRHADGRATVNLLLNRFSPWLDIASSLPFEGKVVIGNKTAKTISVRIPAWVSRRDLRSTVNGRPANPAWLGRYIQFDGLQDGEGLVITFPLRTETVDLALSTINTALPEPPDPNKVINIRADFRGSTCLGTEPLDEGYVAPVGLKMYRRQHYRQEAAPMRQVPYKVVGQPIRWY